MRGGPSEGSPNRGKARRRLGAQLVAAADGGERAERERLDVAAECQGRLGLGLNAVPVANPGERVASSRAAW
jgi:hypothetical protein